MAIVALQVDSLSDAILPEYMVASLHSLDEAQISEQSTQVVKADIRIRPTAENPLQKLLMLAHAQAPSNSPCLQAPQVPASVFLQNSRQVRFGHIVGLCAATMPDNRR